MEWIHHNALEFGRHKSSFVAPQKGGSLLSAFKLTSCLSRPWGIGMWTSNVLFLRSFGDQHKRHRPRTSTFSRHVYSKDRIQRLLGTRLQHLTLQDAILPLKPADRLYLLYLIVSLPLCFSIGDSNPTYWMGVTWRLTVIPLMILLRMCFCSPLTGPILARWYQKVLGYRCSFL